MYYDFSSLDISWTLYIIVHSSMESGGSRDYTGYKREKHDDVYDGKTKRNKGGKKE